MKSKDTVISTKVRGISHYFLVECQDINPVLSGNYSTWYEIRIYILGLHTSSAGYDLYSDALSQWKEI